MIQAIFNRIGRENALQLSPGFFAGSNGDLSSTAGQARLK